MGPGDFTFDVGSRISVGEEFKVCNEHTGHCEYGENSPEKDPEKVYFNQ
jgi:hypothetical protein